MYLASAFFMVIIPIQDVVEYFFPETIESFSFLFFSLLIFIWNAKVFSSAKTKSKIALNALLSMVIFLLLSAVIIFILFQTIPIQFE